jgi:aminoacyl tRNA synthase complex-interacting multifunctional protein 1
MAKAAGDNATLCFVASASGAACGASLPLQTADGQQIEQLNTALRHLCSTATSPQLTALLGQQIEQLNTALRHLCSTATSPQLTALLGTSPLEKAQVDSWLSQAAAGGFEKHLQSLNDHLASRSFLCAPRLTLGDIAVYFAVQKIAVPEALAHIARWSHQCYHSLKALAPSCTALPAAAAVHRALAPLVLPVPTAPASLANAGKAAAAVKQPAAKADAATAEAPAAVAAAAAGSEAADGTAPPAAKKQKAAKKDAAPKAAAAAVAAASVEDELDPTKLDIRVGVIVKAWEHPEAEKLFCEEIDVGEDKPRLIASGLRPFYSLAEMQGRRVLVLANLKARALVGFKSEGEISLHHVLLRCWRDALQ